MDQAWIALGVGTVVPLLLLRGMDTQTRSVEALKWMIAGALLTVPAILVEWQAHSLVKAAGLSVYTVAAINALLIAALIEEAVRFFAIDHAFKRFAPNFRDLLFMALWMSMGFAIAENTLYIFGARPERMLATATVRVLLPNVMHLFCGVFIAGGVYGIFGRLSALAIIGAILFHGFYDWLAGSETVGAGALFGTLALGLVVVGTVVRRGRILESGHSDR